MTTTTPAAPATSGRATGVRPRRSRRSRRGTMLRYAALGLAALAAAFPIYWMVVSSISADSSFAWPPKIIPTDISFTAYSRVVDGTEITTWFLNTLIVALGTTALSLFVGISAGLSLSRYPKNLLGRTTAFSVLLTQMLPATLLVIPIYIVFSQIGLIDSLPGLILADSAFAIPLAVWMMKGFFDGLPTELEEAAQVDGCTELMAYLRITIPLALPGIVAVSIFSFMVAWDEFFFARTLVNSDSNWVLSIGLASFQGEYTLKWADMLAAATLFSIPPLIFFILMQRKLITGLTGGAVKG